MSKVEEGGMKHEAMGDGLRETVGRERRYGRGMGIAIALSTTIALCIAGLLVPHHRKKPDSFKTCSLWAFYLEFFREMPSLRRKRERLLLALGALGVLATIYPAILALGIVLTRGALGAGQAGGAWFVLGGIAALLGCCANFLAMIFSQMTFGFGGNSMERNPRWFFWAILIFQGAFAAASIAIGVCAACATWAGRAVGI